MVLCAASVCGHGAGVLHVHPATGDHTACRSDGITRHQRPGSRAAWRSAGTGRIGNRRSCHATEWRRPVTQRLQGAVPRWPKQPVEWRDHPIGSQPRSACGFTTAVEITNVDCSGNSSHRGRCLHRDTWSLWRFFGRHRRTTTATAPNEPSSHTCASLMTSMHGRNSVEDLPQ
jgi:hypothetical protein